MKSIIYFLPRNTSYELPGSTDNICLMKVWHKILCLFVYLQCIERLHVLYQLWPEQQTNALLLFLELLRLSPYVRPPLSLQPTTQEWAGCLQCCTAVHCTELHCTALHCTALHCTALHCTALHCTALHCTALHCTALNCTALHCTALHDTTLYCTALHRTALYCKSQHCTVLHCTAL